MPNQLEELPLESLLKLQKRLLKLRPPRKTDRFAVVQGTFLGVKVSFRVPFNELETVLDKITANDNKHISVGDELVFTLSDCLWEAKFRREKKQPRGKQVALQSVVGLAKAASPWVYLFIREVIQKQKIKPYLPQLNKAKNKLARALERYHVKWDDLPPESQAIYLTAAVVSEACESWSRLDLKEPFSDQDFNLKYFRRTYIAPKLDDVRSMAKRNWKLLLFPQMNSYLRNTIFTASLDKQV